MKGGDGMKFKHIIPHSIEIAASDNGGILVRVGCTNFTYSANEIKTLAADLVEYLENPSKLEKQREEDLYKNLEVAPAGCSAPTQPEEPERRR